MKVIKICIAYIVLFFSLLIYGQQTPHYTQYMFNTVIINPAYAGARADLTIGGLSRTQWVGIDGAPKTQTFSINARTFDGVGMGLSVIHDQIGLLKSTDISFDLSYTLVMGYRQRLALGLKGTYATYKNDLASGITVDDEVYASLHGNHPNVGFGMFYYNETFFGGIAIPQLLKTPKFVLEDNFQPGITTNTNVFASFGARMDVNDDLKFKPSTLVKYTSGLPISIDINSNFLYKEWLELGVSYRYNDSVSGMIAILPTKSMRIGYAYDYTLSNLSKFNSGTHEIILLFDIDFAKRGRWLNGQSCYF
jgi:type IX secretion system PorP/SprF family membrane protein